MRTDSSKNKELYERLKILCKCYSSGKFDWLFPFLAETCVFESQWVLTPNTGKAAVVEYLSGKGETMRKHNCCPDCIIVALVGNLNTIKNANVHINGGEAKRASFGLWYPDGKLAMLMSQKLNGKVTSVLVDMQLDENDRISRIDLCMPELFNFRYYDGPFDVGDDMPLKQDTIEQIVRDLLIANPDDFEELDAFVAKNTDDYPGDLTAYVLGLAEDMGNSTYIKEHIGKHATD